MPGVLTRHILGSSSVDNSLRNRSCTTDDVLQSNIYLWSSAPSLEIELSLPSVRRTILLLSSSEHVADIVFFRCTNIQNIVKDYRAACSGQWPSNPGPRNYKMYAGGDITCFLGMWLVDSSHRNTVARVLPDCGKIVKHRQVRGYERVGEHCLSVCLSNTYYI